MKLHIWWRSTFFVIATLCVLFQAERTQAQQTASTVRRQSLIPQPLPADLQPISYADAKRVNLWWSTKNFGISPPLPPGAVSPDEDGVSLYYSPSANAIFVDNQNSDDSLMQSGLQLSMIASDGSTVQADGVTSLDAGFAPGTFYICSITVTGQVINLVLTNTFQNIAYEIQSKDALTNTTDWVSEGSFPGLDGSTPVTLWMGNRTNQLLLRARSSIASSVSGIPNWWMMKNFGSDPTTWPDAYADINNDGHTVIEAYHNNWDPHASHTPPPPQSVTVRIQPDGTTVLITWASGGGPVSQYAVENSYSGNELIRLPASTFSYTISLSFAPALAPTLLPSYRVRAYFANGTSAVSPAVSVGDPALNISGGLVRGPGFSAYLLISPVPQAASVIRLISESFLNPPPIDIPITSFQNGAVLLTNWALLYSQGYRDARAISASGTPGDAIGLWEDNNPTTQELWYWREYPGSTVPAPEDVFVNASRHMKENLRFLLRSAMVTWPFGYMCDRATYGLENSSSAWNFLNNPETFYVRPPGSGDYEYYGFHVYSPNLGWSILDEMRPVQENFLWTNFIMSASWPFLARWNESYQIHWFNAAEQPFQPSGNDTNPPLAFTLSADDAWTYGLDPTVSDPGQIGLSVDSNWNATVLPSVVNNYGLPLRSLATWTTDGDKVVPLIMHSGESSSVGAEYFTDFTAPNLRITNYFFASQTPYLKQFPWIYGSEDDLPYYEGPPMPIPGSPGFSPTNTSPLLIIGVGQPMTVSAWAKMAIDNAVNGYGDKFGYLEQYMEQALVVNNSGNITTNQAGIVSPYGGFFPTMPGPAALVTMADVDTGQRGTGVVNVIKLQLDVNHDGNMDVSFGGPDNTSQVRPYVFWVNNDCDWSSYTGDPGSDIAVDPENPNYFWDCRQPSPRSIRDLEDYARLWICGVPALTNDGYQVTLSWDTVSSGNPSINLLQAFETNGGTLYLTDTNILSFSSTPWRQIGYGTVYGQVDYGRKYHVTTNSPLTLPISWFTNTGNKYFLFEGASIGSGRLLLTISRSGQTVAQTDAWLDLHDVSDFCEQACATNVTSGRPPSSLVSGFKLIKTVNAPALDETKQIIVFIHGINNTAEDYEETTRTIFKRLYWSGYRGRFASFRWPCAYLPWNTANPFQYNLGEFYAFKSATGLKNYLSHLRNNRADLAGYAINLYAHSQGNVVTSEAVLQGAPFDNYILTQGAFPAHCYDTNAPFLQKLLDAETNSANATETPFYPSTGGYHGYCSNIHGNLVDFFNINDFALSTGTTLGLQTNWEEDQRAQKPEAFLGGPSYFFNPATQLTTGYYTFSSYNVTDLQEIKALVARSRSKAVGAQGGLHGAIGGSVDLFSNYGFGNTRPEHSAQFVRPIQTCLPYYRQALTSFQILP